MTKFPDAPLNTKHPAIFYRFGAISLQWNQTDYRLELLLGLYLTNESDEILARLNNSQRAELLDMFVRKREPRGWQRHILHVMKGINICRVNRNFLLHGLVRKMGDDFIVLERFTRKLKPKKRYKIELDHLKEVERALMIYGSLLEHVLHHCEPMRKLRHQTRIALPERPPLPDKLEKSLPEVPIDNQLPPRSSGE